MKRKKSQPEFVLCVRNDGCDDLEVRKVYQVLPDQAADQEGYLRVIDESGEDYLYPAGYFVTIELPKVANKKKVKLTKLILPKREIDKLGPQEKKRYIVFTCMVRDLNLLQKCLIFVGNENSSDKPSVSAKTTISFFFLKTLISKVHEMWTFLSKNKILQTSASFSKELKEKCNEIENFFSDKKVKDIFAFIRDKFGFHYVYQDDIDGMIEDASKQFSEFEIWLSDDSANEIFASSNAVMLAVIFSEMKRAGFSGNTESLMRQLYELATTGARLFRELSVFYLAEAFLVNWERREEVVIEVPQYSQVKLPLIVTE